jgi:2-amino-4-hydroxy-6-hydroxymethyldihydropteridine diphosphokinase
MQHPTIHTAILSLGSNIGDRAAWLKKAADALSALPDTKITFRSSIYETEPVDVPEEHSEQSFLNAVLIIETALSPQQLSDAVHKIEDQLQRTRNTPNQPRTIDIDIITQNDIISEDPALTLPHPRAHLRRFVLQPLAEIDPGFTLPGQTSPISELLKAIPEKPAVNLYSKKYSLAP